MKHLKSFNLFEGSSLTRLGVPDEVMKNIQYNYEIEPFAKWKKIGLKKDLVEELKNNEIALFIELSIDYIKVIVNNMNDNFYVQYFFYDPGEWGGTYDIRDKENISRNQLLYGVDSKHLIYKLDGFFENRPKVQRRVQKEMKQFDQTTSDFKVYMLSNFNNIVKRIYGKRYNDVMTKIADNISNFKPNASAEEILEFLRNNKKMAEKAKEYEDAKEDEDILRIKELEKKYNSLPILDEYLISFEEEYSNKLDNRLTIKDLIDTYGRMKIETAFMYYLFTGNLKELNIQTIK
jgi:hypothetical protein